ncbi:zinc-ribbon domain-containing protein [Lysinibacillus sp. FSL K6-1151]|uniref:zinc-ribbon domain-containing protein n=1 Tax=Lysinibacillus sp. FSL K6-1151 TaxID=2921465 RepID=UPI003159CC82
MKIVQSNLLFERYPELHPEWNYGKNIELSPSNLTYGSNKIVWWRCNFGHEWQSKICNRTLLNRGCPYCSGLKVTYEGSLAALHPNLLEEWYKEKNINLDPCKLAPQSNKRVWWLCFYGHEWKTSICHRANGTRCPFCCNKKVAMENSIAVTHPGLINEFHSTKNKFTPNEVTSGSDKKAWWICKVGHEWQASISHRVRGTGCPFCCNQKTILEMSLQYLYPEVATEWHPLKNEKLTAIDVTYGSNRKVWWICEKGHEWQAVIRSRTTSGCKCPYCTNVKVNNDNCLLNTFPLLSTEWDYDKNEEVTPKDVLPGSKRRVWWVCEKGHEWKASISSRTRGTGCSECNSIRQTSFPEQIIFFYLKNAFPDTINRFNYHNQEIDVFIPLLNLAIEYDGSYYHQNAEKDVRKNNELHGKCHLIRIREDGCPPLPDKSCIIFQRENNSFESLKESIEFIFYFIERLSTSLEQRISLKNVSIDIDRDLGQIYNNMSFLEKENSLADQFPKLTKEWHPTKNGVLKPGLVSKYSNKKVWWLCKEGHEWQASVSNRAKGRKCLRCSRANYTQKIRDGNTLAENNFFLSKEWHPTKNGDLTPYQVTRRSGKKVWWQCERGHEWQAAICNRNKKDNSLGTGCPKCY